MTSSVEFRIGFYPFRCPERNDATLESVFREISPSLEALVAWIALELVHLKLDVFSLELLEGSAPAPIAHAAE